eukprot:scaffold305933_cov23-Tisochrysis_lutea.AAC.1
MRNEAMREGSDLGVPSCHMGTAYDYVRWPKRECLPVFPQKGMLLHAWLAKKCNGEERVA